MMWETTWNIAPWGSRFAILRSVNSTGLDKESEMMNTTQTACRNFGAGFRSILLTAFLAIGAHAQTYSVIHTFSGATDGGNPYAGVMLDRAGNLYGSAFYGGNATCNYPWGCGLIYKLKRQGSGWILQPLRSFGQGDTLFPMAQPVFGPEGSLYGTTTAGGGTTGAVLKFQPSSIICRMVSCPWTELNLHYFGNGSDGADPAYGALSFDAAGNGYGTTMTGGTERVGTVYMLQSGDPGRESVLYNFRSNENGYWPYAGVTLDNDGNIYGVTEYPYGTVFKLTRNGTGWTETLLHDFSGEDAYNPMGALTFDAAGNLYGTTANGGPDGGGTVFELTPTGPRWILETIHAFSYMGAFNPAGPTSKLAIDSAGNLYGTTYAAGANNRGSVFKLTPSSQGWIFTSLYDFTGGTDGGEPWGGVTIDSSGNLYGTTLYGGTSQTGCNDGYGCGVIWEITPE